MPPFFLGGFYKLVYYAILLSIILILIFEPFTLGASTFWNYVLLRNLLAHSIANIICSPFTYELLLMHSLFFESHVEAGKELFLIESVEEVQALLSLVKADDVAVNLVPESFTLLLQILWLSHQLDLEWFSIELKFLLWKSLDFFAHILQELFNAFLHLGIF